MFIINGLTSTNHKVQCSTLKVQSLEHFSQFQPSHFLLIKFILDFRQALALLRQFLNR